MLAKLLRFWRAPFPNKVQLLLISYYKIKGTVYYRFVFKKFGRDSFLLKPILIWNPQYISIGERVAVRNGIRLEVLVTGNDRIPSLVIGDDTNIEQNVHVVCHSRVHIGSHVSIAGNCSMADVTHPYSDLDDSRNIGVRIKDEDSFIEIGDGSFIGFGSVILPNVRIGKGAVIGANSVVTRDVPDHAVAAGAPAVILKRYDSLTRTWVKATPIGSLDVHGS
jgi:acetyltransferase-like isoleucine patch superfamily enzyme